MINFDTGAIRDSQDDKESYPESVSFLTLRRYARYMLQQSKKYGTGNWRKGIPTESYEDSLMRHLMKYFINKQYGIEIEPGDHLSAAMFNLQGIIHNEEIKRYETELLNSRDNEERGSDVTQTFTVPRGFQDPWRGSSDSGHWFDGSISYTSKGMGM